MYWKQMFCEIKVSTDKKDFCTKECKLTLFFCCAYIYKCNREVVFTIAMASGKQVRKKKRKKEKCVASFIRQYRTNFATILLHLRPLVD